MNSDYLLEHKARLKEKLEAVELEKAQLARKLKAIDILLEGNDLQEASGQALVSPGANAASQDNDHKESRKRTVPAHAVRTSPRSSLIDAVAEVASKQPGQFTSGELLAALQLEYPEFQLSETKHISSPLSDLVKKGVLILEQKRVGSKSNIYRARQGPTQ